MSYRPARVKARAGYVPDADEEAAFRKAVEAVRDTISLGAEKAAYYCISSWVMERNCIATLANDALSGVSWPLDDNHLRGMAQAMLPKIGEALQQAEIDGSKPFFDLSQEDIASVVVCCFLAMQHATHMNDKIPF